MNRNKLKTYAPKARRDFIESVTARAVQYGLTAKKIESMTVEGDVAMIAGKPYSKAIGEKRKKLEARINRDGFEQTMEAMAYTWFNRLVAIRYMELHGYLDHGYRVLSHPQGHSLPEIVEHAEHVDLPGLDKKKVVELKLDGTKEEELYRMLLIGQCNALSKAIPFLFESIDDETELLLPDHLLHSDSLIRDLVNEIPNEDWQEVEIIGWLYQFYISEKKDEVIGKVVKSEDIPAATQLFTPNWIVKYLVQNSLGRQWMATYPDSPLKEQMEYYIEPAEQTPEVQAKLAEITPDSLNPEELTLLDPACGSGHILVEAYDLLKAIYQERGYRAKDIPRLILEKNLYGLEIDDRAAQLAAFALLMKARADDRNIFERDVQPHVLSIQESKGLDVKEITYALNQPILKEEHPPSGELFEEITDEKSPLFSKKALGVKGSVSQADVEQLIELFEDGKTFGSLIQVPETLAEKLPAIAQRIADVIAHGGMFEQTVARSLKPVVKQACVLEERFHAVVTNPPYMGSRAMNAEVKQFGRNWFPDGKNDLFSMFAVRLGGLALEHGAIGLMTPFTWMFIKSFENLRSHLLENKCVTSLIRPEYHSFFDSAYVPICAFVYMNYPLSIDATFIDLSDFYGEDQQSVKALEAIRDPACKFRHTISTRDFESVPGRIFAYWASPQVLNHFKNSISVGDVASPRQGLSTCNNDLFLRYWHEVDRQRLNLEATTRSEASESNARWFPYAKGGAFRRWYGNNEYVVDWKDDGRAIHEYNKVPMDYAGAPMRGKQFYFREGMTWTSLTIGEFSGRYCPSGFIFDAKGPILFPLDGFPLNVLIGLFNSKVASTFLKILAPTMDYNQGPVGRVPMAIGAELQPEIEAHVETLISLSKEDWDLHEESWDFDRCSLQMPNGTKLDKCWQVFEDECSDRRAKVASVEETINRLLIEAYGLQDELSSDVPEDDITLYQSSREEDIQRLVSYAIGCMVGRYSLDEPGLIYAHSGNEGFTSSKYTTFPADEDGIVPLTEFHWFEDDAASRFEKFVATAWPKDQIEENLKFVAESLGQKRGESPRDTIRRYLAVDFFKHHLSLYKKRPIYWLFSSGKQRGFQALVYLHRYNEGTLARMRTEYVIPLLGKMTARIDHLTDEIAAASSSQHQKRLEKEKATIVKQLAEVQEFDEKLRHYADQRISLDLDDGVKVNYGKFGTLLAEVKGVTGKKAEDQDQTNRQMGDSNVF